MPVQAIDLIKKLMAKAGVTYDGDLTTEIPDEVATSLDNQLLTIAAATNNHPAVKKVYFAQAFNGLDAELNDLIVEFGITDEVKAEIEKAGGSTKRAVALARKIKELTEKSKPEDKTKADALTAQIVDLNKKLATEIQGKATDKANYDKQLQQIKIDTKLAERIGSRKTMFDDLDPVAKEAGLKAILNKNLQDSDAEFTFDEKGNLSLIKKDGTNLFGENHTIVTPDAFIDKSFSKILKVTTPGSPGGNITPPAATLSGNTQNSNPALAAALAESRQNYEASIKVAV